MVDGSGWAKFFLDVKTKKRQLERDYFVRNVNEAMDNLTVVHEAMISALRDTDELLAKADRVNDLESLMGSLNRIRDKGQPQRHKLYEEAKATENSARSLTGQEYIDVSEFAGLICAYFVRDNMYKHEMGHISFTLQMVAAPQEDDSSPDRARRLQSVDDQLRIMKAGINEAIAIYKEQFREICKKQAELKARYLMP